MGIQKNPLQKWYKLAIGAQSYTVEFTAANRQVDWLKIYLGYDKNNQHKTTYSSYIAEVTSESIQNVRLENIWNTYSIANEMRYGTDDAMKNIFYKQFVAWCRNGYSMTLLTNQVNNLIFQELLQKCKYFSSADERIYIDTRDSKEYTDELEN